LAEEEYEMLRLLRPEGTTLDKRPRSLLESGLGKGLSDANQEPRLKSHCVDLALALHYYFIPSFMRAANTLT